MSQRGNLCINDFTLFFVFLSSSFPNSISTKLSVCPTPATSAMARASLKYFGYSFSPLQVPY